MNILTCAIKGLDCYFSIQLPVAYFGPCVHSELICKCKQCGWNHSNDFFLREIHLSRTENTNCARGILNSLCSNKHFTLKVTAQTILTHHFWYLAVRKPLKTSASDATWCRLSRMTTEGSALADVASHWSAMLARYCRNSLADLWSTLNTATHPAVSSLPDLKVRKISVFFLYTGIHKVCSAVHKLVLCFSHHESKLCIPTYTCKSTICTSKQNLLHTFIIIILVSRCELYYCMSPPFWYSGYTTTVHHCFSIRL